MTAQKAIENELSGLAMIQVVKQAFHTPLAEGGKRISYSKENMTNTPRAEHQLI